MAPLARHFSAVYPSLVLMAGSIEAFRTSAQQPLARVA